MVFCCLLSWIVGLILQALLVLLCHGWAAKPKWQCGMAETVGCYHLHCKLIFQTDGYQQFDSRPPPALLSYKHTELTCLQLPILFIYSPQAQLSWECLCIQPFNWSFQTLATCKSFQKMKSWRATGESRHEMQVGLKDGFYLEFIEIFQNSYFWQGFKWKLLPPILLNLLSPSHTMVFTVINM